MSLLIDPEMYAPGASAGTETKPHEKPIETEEGVATDGSLGAWAASLALKGVEKVKDGFRVVDALSKKGGGKSAAEVERLRAINLAAAEVWEVYNKEGERVENDAASGVLGHAVGFFDYLLRNDEKTVHDDRAEKWALERELVAEIKKMIVSGEADTLREALNLIRSYGSASLREPAKKFLEEKGESGHRKGYPLWELVDFASRPGKDSATAHDLLERAFELEYDNDAVDTPFAVYSLVHAVSSDTKVREKAEKGMKALSGESSFGRAAAKFVFSSTPEGAAVDVGLMFASAGLGNLAKLSALAKLEKAGVVGYKALALGKVAEIGAETTALWALNTGREAFTHDVGKVLDPVHLAKSLATTGLMIGVVKVFSAGGNALAKGLGLVPKSAEELAALPFWKKAAGFGLGHASGLTGMIASTESGKALDLESGPIGGTNESLVHAIFGYVKFALAHEAADRLLGGKLSEISHRLHAKTAAVEAKIIEDAESGVTVELHDEDILTSDTEVLPAAARRAIILPTRPVAAGARPKTAGDLAPTEHPVSLGAYRKGLASSSGTFHAARIRLEAIHRKIAKGALDPVDSVVLKEIEKCETILGKYRTLEITGADAAPKLHARLLIKKSAEATVLAVGGEAVIYDYGDGRVLKVAKVKKTLGPDGRVITLDPSARLDAEQKALSIVSRLAAENSDLIDFTPSVTGRPAPDRLEMSKLPGESLAKLSRISPERLIAIPEAAWSKFMANLAFLNEKGLAHGDVNSENILWDGERLRLVDFGSAKLGKKIYTDHKGRKVLLDVRRAEILREDLSKKDFKGFPLRVPPKITGVAAILPLEPVARKPSTDFMTGGNGRHNDAAKFMTDEVLRRLKESGISVDAADVRRRVHDELARHKLPGLERNGNVPRKLWGAVMDRVTSDLTPTEPRRAVASALETTEAVHAWIETHLEEAGGLRDRIRTELRAEFSRMMDEWGGVERLEDLHEGFRGDVVERFKESATARLMGSMGAGAMMVFGPGFAEMPLWQKGLSLAAGAAILGIPILAKGAKRVKDAWSRGAGEEKRPSTTESGEAANEEERGLEVGFKDGGTDLEDGNRWFRKVSSDSP